MALPTGTGTGVDERTDERVDPRIGDGDHERYAHIVWTRGRNAEAVVLEARVTGTPLVALCGKRWVPARDPKRFPMCPTCKEIRDRARRSEGADG